MYFSLGKPSGYFYCVFLCLYNYKISGCRELFIWKTSLYGVRQDWLTQRLNWESEGSQQWAVVMSPSSLSLKNNLTTTANIKVHTWWCLQVDTYHIQVQSNYMAANYYWDDSYIIQRRIIIMQQQNDYMVHCPIKLLCLCLVLCHSMWLRELSLVYWLPQMVTV